MGQGATVLETFGNIDKRNDVSASVTFAIRKVCEYYRKGDILDVGCGSGRNTQLFGHIDANILGIDIDKNEIVRAQHANSSKNIQFSCMSVSEIQDRQFATVVLIEVLEHIKEPLEFLREIYRLCAPDGFLVATVPNGYSLKEIVMALIRCLKKIALFARVIRWYKGMIGRDKVFNDSPHLQMFTLKEIRSLLRAAGFAIEEESYSDIWSGFLWMYFSWVESPFFVRRIESKVARYLPHFLLGDWAFLCMKRANADTELAGISG
jgi:2-polyprenyl-3-methyl-5-hydroxy-6-metoxy-1,4-benzoquinol methylase